MRKLFFITLVFIYLGIGLFLCVTGHCAPMLRSSQKTALLEVLASRSTSYVNAPKWFDERFPQQRSFVEDKAKLKALFCTRRAAKSFSGGIHILKDLYETPGTNGLFLGLTRESARKIIWKDVFKKLNTTHDLKADFNESRLTVTLPNSSVCYISGVDADAEEMEKLLGGKYKIVVLDEGASYHIDLRRLIYGILKPAIADDRGTICVAGTSGDVTQGLFFDITRRDGQPREPGWSLHEWSAHANPFVCKQWQEELDEIDRERPLFKTTPLYKQWYLNQWVIDTNKLVYRFDEVKNTFDSLPHFATGEWQYVLGVDLGHSPDPSAFSVVAFHSHDKNLYVLESNEQLEMDVTDVANRIQDLSARYPFFKIVIDGSNKQAVAEMQNRHGIALQAADKRGKSDFISIMNSEFIQKKIKLQKDRNKNLISQYQKLVWVTDGGKIRIPREEHPNLPNHTTDATLYAWRFCYPYLSEAPVRKPDLKNREDYLAHTQKLMEEKMEESAKRDEAAEKQEDIFQIASLEDQMDVARHYINKKRGR